MLNSNLMLVCLFYWYLFIILEVYGFIKIVFNKGIKILDRIFYNFFLICVIKKKI